MPPPPANSPAAMLLILIMPPLFTTFSIRTLMQELIHVVTRQEGLVRVKIGHTITLEFTKIIQIQEHNVTSFEIRGTLSHDQAWVPDGAHGRS